MLIPGQIEKEPVAPYANAAPNRKNADANAPSRKFQRRLLRDQPSTPRQSAQQVQRQRHDFRATNMVSRSPHAPNSIIPPTANRASRNTSVVVRRRGSPRIRRRCRAPTHPTR